MYKVGAAGKGRGLTLTLALLLALTACGGGDIEIRPAESASAAPAEAAIQIGLVCCGGEAQALLRSRAATQEALAREGVTVTWQVVEAAEDDSAAQANYACAQNGCRLVVNSSANLERYVGAAAQDYPGVHFVTCGGRTDWQDTLENTHTAYARTYECCYLAGLAAGESQWAAEAPTGPWGYVAHTAVAADISDFTAYYLGLKAACPQATMKVYFMGDEGDAAQAVSALEQAGCTRITLPDERGGADSPIDWSVYLTHAALVLTAGESLEQDWQGGLAEGVFGAFLPDASPAVERARQELLSGERQVFDTAAFTVGGERLKRAWALDTDGDSIADGGEAVFDGAFHEGCYRSAPYFDFRVDGIEWLNVIF